MYFGLLFLFSNTDSFLFKNFWLGFLIQYDLLIASTWSSCPSLILIWGDVSFERTTVVLLASGIVLILSDNNIGIIVDVEVINMSSPLGSDWSLVMNMKFHFTFIVLVSAKYIHEPLLLSSYPIYLPFLTCLPNLFLPA